MKKYSMTIGFILSIFLFVGFLNEEEAYAYETVTGVTQQQLSTLDAIITAAILDRSTQINVSDCAIGNSYIGGAYYEVYWNNPLMFLVNWKSYGLSGNGNVLYLNVEYRYDITTENEVLEEFSNETDKIINGCDPAWTDLEKALYVHDYIVENYSYDYDNYLKYKSTGNSSYMPPEDFSAMGIMVEKVGVCQGYALAYNYILGELGITSWMVTSSTMNHAWSQVLLNGKYYHVDTTWDDVVYDTTGRVGHNYFLLSDSAITTKNHSGWVKKHTASSTSYDSYFWTNVYSAFQYMNNKWYYIKTSDAKIYSYSFGTGTATPLYTLPDKYWTVFGASGYYTGCYSSLTKFNSNLYFNTKNKIYLFNTTNNTATEQETAITTNGWVYGIGAIGDKIMYHIKKTCGEKGALFASGITSDGYDANALRAFTLSKTTIALIYGDTAGSDIDVSTYTPDTAGEGLTPLWESSNTNVATVDENGLVKAVNKGTAIITCTISGISRTCNVTVAKKSLPTSATVSNQTYSGKYLTPDITMMDGEDQLVKNVDYMLQYAYNLKVGKALITIYGIGNYKGTVYKNFYILPGAVRNFAQAYGTVNMNKLTWSSVYGASGYEIYTLKSSGAYARIGLATELKYFHMNLASGFTYNYKIRAYTKVGTKYYFGSYTDALSAATKPAQAKALSAEKASKSMVDLKWNSVTGATKYQVFTYDKKTKAYVLTKTVKSTNCTITGLKAGTIYEFRVRAVKELNGKVYAGSYSKVETAKTKQ